MSFVRRAVKGLQHRAVSGAMTYTLGNMLQRVAVFLLIPFYTQTLTVDQYGLWGLLATIQMVLVTILNMGMRQTIVRHYYDHADSPERLRSYLTVSFVQRLVTSLILGTIILMFGGPIWNLVTDGQAAYWQYAPMLMVWVVGDLMVSYVTGLFQAQRRPKPFIVASLAKTVIQLSLGIYLVVVTKQGVQGAVMGQMIGALSVGAVLSIMHIASYVRFRDLHWSDAVENFKYGYPLISHELAGWARNMSDRVILVQFVTLSVIGLYQLGYTPGLVLMVLIGGIDHAFSPFFFKAMKEKGEEAKPLLRSVACVYAAGLAILGAACCLFVNEAIIVVSNNEYWPAAAFAPLVIVAFCFHGQYTQFAKMLFYHKKTGLVARITTTAGIVSIALNFLLIPVMGAMAAVWVTWLTYLAVFVGVSIASQRVDPIKYPVRSFILVNGLLTIVAIGTTYINAGVPPTLVSIAIKLLVLAVFAAATWRVLGKPNSKPVFRALQGKANKTPKVTEDQLVNA